MRIEPNTRQGLVVGLLFFHVRSASKKNAPHEKSATTNKVKLTSLLTSREGSSLCKHK